MAASNNAANRRDRGEALIGVAVQREVPRSTIRTLYRKVRTLTKASDQREIHHARVGLPLEVHMAQYSKTQEAVSRLSPEQFHVTQQNGTEQPFQNEFWDHNEPGIYVDVVSGEPLFSSLDKFDSACGWPSFAKPLEGESIDELHDDNHGMSRTEVRSTKYRHPISNTPSKIVPTGNRSRMAAANGGALSGGSITIALVGCRRVNVTSSDYV